jgi:hypothetical protein
MSGSFIQSRFGSPGNFEVVAPARTTTGLVHYWRNNSVPNSPWSGPTHFGGGIGNVDAASLIQSSYGNPGNLEVVVIASNQLVHFWRDSGPSFTWNGPFSIASGVAGIPGLIQGRFGTPGNFEVVAPNASGGLVHYWRNNQIPNTPWNGPTPFGQSLGQVDAVSLIESSYGNPGNLEVVASASGQVYHFWRDSGPSFTWHGPFALNGILGFVPSLIQGRFGSPGNFELVVSIPTGGLAHYWRNNQDPSFPWNLGATFGGLIPYGAPSLIESNYGNPGNLEVIAGTFDPQAGNELARSWRDSGPSFTWNGPFIVESGL